MPPPLLSLLAGLRGRKAEEAFARLCAAPDDDAPRLEIARMLARAGQVERAALIKAQLARSRGDPALAELERRLLTEYGPAWRREELPDLPSVRWGDYERGFAAALDVADPEVLIHLGADLRAGAPIERIRIRNLRLPQLRKLVHSGHLNGVYEIDLSDNVIGLAGAQALAEVPVAAGWRRLVLRKTELGPLGLDALMGGPIVAHLEALDLSANALGHAGAELQTAAALRELNVAENDWTDLPLQALTRAAALPKLTALVLHHNLVGDDGVRAITGHPRWTGLQALDLRANQFGDTGLLELAAAPLLPTLAKLRLGENRIGKRATLALLRSPRCARLTTLDLAKVEPNEESLRLIAGMAALTALDLSHNGLHGGDLRPLVASPQLARLRMLRLRDNRLMAAGARLLADSPYLRPGELDLGLNQLGNSGVAILAARPGPHTLLLDGNGITAAGARALAAGLGQVRQLALADNAIGDEGCRALTSAPQLERLDLTKTGLAADGAQALLAWPGLPRLRELRLGGNAVPADVLLALRVACGGEVTW